MPATYYLHLQVTLHSRHMMLEHYLHQNLAVHESAQRLLTYKQDKCNSLHCQHVISIARRQPCWGWVPQSHPWKAGVHIAIAKLQVQCQVVAS